MTPRALPQRAHARAAPRARARVAARARSRELERRLPLSVPVLIGGDPGARGGHRVHRPGPARPRWWREARRRRRGRGRGGGRGRGARASATGARGRRPSGRRCWSAPRRCCASAGSSWRRSRCASAPSRGARPTPTSARRSTSSSTTPAARIELERGPELLQVPGERNSMRYAPRGVAAVIAPWNFPLAIPAGMTAAALAAGNAAVLKPAEQSPGQRAGAGRGAARGRGAAGRRSTSCPGFGEAGAALVRHPGVHVIAFTGSSAVGLEIVRAAGETPEGQRHVKRVVAEMGGKNCVIVDSDADLDEAVPAHRRLGLRLRGPEVLRGGARARPRGGRRRAGRAPGRRRAACCASARPRSSPPTCPPVIEREAQERVERYARTAAAGRPAGVRGRRGPGRGLVLPAAAGGGPRPGLAGAARRGLRAAADGGAGAERRAACDVVDSLPFALTGGLFSRSPATVELRGGAHAGGQPLREPRDHRRDGRPPALRRQPPLGYRRRRPAARTTWCSSPSRGW